MFDVTNEIFYHINTGKKLQIGDILVIGDEFNKFYYDIYNIEHLSNLKDANEYLIEMKKNKSYTFDKNIFDLIFQTVNDDAMITRELIFEEERKKINLDLPSRLKCLYVCKTNEEVRQWIDIFKRTNKKDFQILKLNLNGKMFIGDASFILRQNISLNKKKIQARKYWNADKKDNINEYLFIGTAEVKEILNL